MTKCLLYMAPIVLIGLVATEAPAASAARAGSMGRNITATAPEGTGVPLGLVCQRGGRGGGGARAGGGGYRGGAGSWAGAGRGNFSGANANRGNFSGAVRLRPEVDVARHLAQRSRELDNNSEPTQRVRPER